MNFIELDIYEYKANISEKQYKIVSYMNSIILCVYGIDNKSDKLILGFYTPQFVSCKSKFKRPVLEFTGIHPTILTDTSNLDDADKYIECFINKEKELLEKFLNGFESLYLSISISVNGLVYRCINEYKLDQISFQLLDEYLAKMSPALGVPVGEPTMSLIRFGNQDDMFNTNRYIVEHVEIKDDRYNDGNTENVRRNYNYGNCEYGDCNLCDISEFCDHYDSNRKNLLKVTMYKVLSLEASNEDEDILNIRTIRLPLEPYVHCCSMASLRFCGYYALISSHFKYYSELYPAIVKYVDLEYNKKTNVISDSNREYCVDDESVIKFNAWISAMSFEEIRLDASNLK